MKNIHTEYEKKEIKQEIEEDILKKFEEKKKKEFEELKLIIQNQVKEEYQKEKKLIKQEKIDIDSKELINKESKVKIKKTPTVNINNLNSKLIIGNKLALKSIKDFKEATSLDSKISSISDLIAMSNVALEKDFENNNEKKENEKIKIEKRKNDLTILQEIEWRINENNRNDTIMVILDNETVQKLVLSLKEFNNDKSKFVLELKSNTLRCNNFEHLYFLNIDIDEDIDCSRLFEYEMTTIWPLILFFYEKWFTKFKSKLDLFIDQSKDNTLTDLQKNTLFNIFRTIDKNLELIKSHKDEVSEKLLNNKKNIFRVNN